MKPIETRAYGCRFRSRLEARYAVFLTHLGVKWFYEPEGFCLPSSYYLPDFFLPEVDGGTWLEIKPNRYSVFGYSSKAAMGKTDSRKLQEFSEVARDNDQNFFIAYGLPSQDYFLSSFPSYDMDGMLESLYDPSMWCVCGCGKTVGIQFDGRGARIDCHHTGCRVSSHGDKGYSYDHPLIISAAEAALSARFEHGEQP
jgi:hypothetical protein